MDCTAYYDYVEHVPCANKVLLSEYAQECDGV